MGRIGQAKVARAGGYHEYVCNLIDALLPRERLEPERTLIVTVRGF
jgi:hypothetical protein